MAVFGAVAVATLAYLHDRPAPSRELPSRTPATPVAALLLYTRASRRMMASRAIPASTMEKKARLYAACGAPRLFAKGNLAVTRWPVSERNCAPFLFRMEDGHWRIDLARMSRIYGFGRSGGWRFRAGTPPADLAFAFTDWQFDANGHPYRR